MSIFDGKNRPLIESKIYLPRLETKVKTIFEYLVIRFPYLEKNTLAKRVEQGKIFFSDKTPILLSSAYQEGITLFYYRENDQEVEIPFKENIIFENKEIIVVDKPHFIPVTPSGKYTYESLLFRLVKKYENKDLTPVHRLDKDTAGLVIFSKNPKTRYLYHNLFQNREISKIYYAVCNIKNKIERTLWTVENRIVKGEPWYKMKIEDGQINSSTYVKLLYIKENKGLFLLEPKTGKKHQLRLHLSSLGFNIVNDPLYPEVLNIEDYAFPMQLLAAKLSFQDPVTKEPFSFFSQQSLDLPILKP
ncbi:MAG: pseudouridine synthase [Acidobacteria bacterium]|nr:pseudouridine synthase [Acidobacteriota bacterium]